MQGLRYDISIDDAGAADGAMCGTVTNRSDAAWERGTGVGELKLGWRITTAGGASVLEGRGDPLPDALAPGEPVAFRAAMDLAGLDPGRYRIEVGLLREQLYWFHVHGVPPYRSDLVMLAPPAPPERAASGRPAPILHPAPAHPYAGLPAYRFWSRAVARQPAGRLGPMADPPFAIRPDDRVATAGSCFAQHIARRLRTRFRFVEAEPPPPGTDGGFSAGYGNIYTARQLHQLLLRAYGLMRPRDVAWRRADGRYIDPFRPQLFPDGFLSADAVADARDAHLLRVRRVIEDSDVFVFTLGLTEAWVNEGDGAVLPVPPGVVAASAGRGPYGFVNFTPDAVAADLSAFIAAARLVNPLLRIVLTVSPVPLVATFHGDHVLSANGYSKAALRTAAQQTVAGHDGVAYFPSFELVTSPAVRGAWYAADQRSVTDEGVGQVMDAFAQAFLRTDVVATPPAEPPLPAALPDADRDAWQADRASLRAVICDEELLNSDAPGA